MAGQFNQRIVITGVGVASPNGSNLQEYRENLLSGVSGVRHFEVRLLGQVAAGICEFDEFKYSTKKHRRRGTRAGSLAIYCAHEALNDAGIDVEQTDRSRIGIYLGITEHGNIQTENEIFNIKEYDFNTNYWSHFQNPRTVSNSPAGEITLNLKITGPHYTLGGACAAGNIGIVTGTQMLRLEEVDLALVGGVSECPHGFGVHAGFKSEGEMATHEDPARACRPFDSNRNGTVVSEGGCILTLERLEQAQKRQAKIYGEIAGYHINSDAVDFVLPFAERQAECIEMSLRKAGIKPEDVDIINTHATATRAGDIEECKAITKVFGNSPSTYINNTKSFIGHTMGAAGALELVGNLQSFVDRIVHPTINLDDVDPECKSLNLVIGKPKKIDKVDYILNNSFGMMGINSTLVVKRYVP